MIGHHQAVVQTLLDLHPGVGIAESVQPWQELKGMPAEADGVIPGYGALILEAQYPLQAEDGLWLAVS